MTVNEGLRLVAGLFVILSVLLGHFVSPYFLLFTLFVGANQIQSSLTGWCPLMGILARFGLHDDRRVVSAT